MGKTKKKFHLWKFVKPYKVPFFIAVISIVVENGLEISLPFLMNVMLKNGMNKVGNTYTYDAPFVYMIGGIMLAFAVASFFLGLLSAKMTAIAGRGFGYELRKEEYKKIQDFSFANLDQFRINSLITRMTNDVQIVSDTFCQMLRPILRGPFQLVFALAFAFTISVDLSIVFAVVIPLLAIALGTIILLTRPKFYKLQKAIDNVNRTTEESLTAMKLVRANAKKDYEIEKFTKVNNEVKLIGTKGMVLMATNMGIMQFMTYACTVGILLLGGLSVFENWHPSVSTADTAANIASFLSYATQTMASLMMISNVFMMFTRSGASIERVKEVFCSESEIKENKESKLSVETGDITFDNVSFKYNNEADEYVLKNINFEIKDGETIGILGETGSSKSTLIYLIERFYDVSEGKILISGHNVKDYTLEELRKKIAISFQSPRLFTGTVKDNLLWGKPDATDEEIEEACKIACCHDFIVNSLSNGYDTMIGQGGGNVSGGQRQRICIARALIRNPKILIMDDSFSALDRITEGQLKENLKTKLPHMTKIIISQKVSAIADADKIIVLNDGKINNIGTGEWLSQNDPIYQDIYSIQKEGH